MGVWYLDISRCDKWSASCRSDTCTTTVHADTISVAVHASDITALANPQFDHRAGHFVLRPRGFPMGITLTRSQRENIPGQRNRGRQFVFNINSGYGPCGETLSRFRLPRSDYSFPCPAALSSWRWSLLLVVPRRST